MNRRDYLSQTKICPVCKREFHNRAKWEKRGIWKDVKYCSKRCRNDKKEKV